MKDNNNFNSKLYLDVEKNIGSEFIFLNSEPWKKYNTDEVCGVILNLISVKTTQNVKVKIKNDGKVLPTLLPTEKFQKIEFDELEGVAYLFGDKLISVYIAKGVKF